MRFCVMTIFALAWSACAAIAEPIHVAAKNGDVEELSRLLAEGTPVDLPETEDSYRADVSPLVVAVKWGRREAVRLLLDRGADPNFAPRNPDIASESFETSETPLMHAARSGRAEIMEMLLAAGADPNFMTDAGTALHFARLLKRSEIADRLLAAGALPSVSQPSIEPYLADADLERGRLLRRRCQNCHGDIADRSLVGKGRNIALWDILGAPKASQPGMEYTDALAGFGGTWTFDDMNSWLANPGGFVPGTTMWGRGLPDQRDRIDLIAYMRTLSDYPIALPER